MQVHWNDLDWACINALITWRSIMNYYSSIQGDYFISLIHRRSGVSIGGMGEMAQMEEFYWGKFVFWHAWNSLRKEQNVDSTDYVLCSTEHSLYIRWQTSAPATNVSSIFIPVGSWLVPLVTVVLWQKFQMLQDSQSLLGCQSSWKITLRGYPECWNVVPRRSWLCIHMWRAE